jgi:hypothetical protein
MAGSRTGGYAGAACPLCLQPLDLANLVSGIQRCSRCRGSFQAVRFTPPERDVRVLGLGESSTGSETACANHPGNAAPGNCQRCGIFMCSLCRIDADEMSLCPACFDRLSAEGALASTRTTFRDYSRQASTLALVGFPLMSMGALIGPAAVYYAIRALRDARARQENEGRARSWISLLAGLAETAVGGFMIYAIVGGMSR